MAFFDNWRVQLASIGALSEEQERLLQSLETEYSSADAARQEKIFEEYTDSVNRSQCTLVTTATFTMTTGTIYSMMWVKSCELFPELAVIKDNDTRHAILACSTKEAQENVLRQYLARTNSSSQ